MHLQQLELQTFWSNIFFFFSSRQYLAADILAWVSVAKKKKKESAE